MGNLSPNFSLEEFITCISDLNERIIHSKTYKGAIPQPEFIEGLEIFRKKAGAPVQIISGIRSPDYNAARGGSKNSYHIPKPYKKIQNEPERWIYMFNCADLTVRGATVEQMLYWAMDIKAFREGGIGIYPSQNFIHMDTRPDGPSRWARRKNGVYTALDKGLVER